MTLSINPLILSLFIIHKLNQVQPAKSALYHKYIHNARIRTKSGDIMPAPVQNENDGPFVQKLSSISRWWPQSIRPSARALLSTWPRVTDEDPPSSFCGEHQQEDRCACLIVLTHHFFLLGSSLPGLPRLRWVKTDELPPFTPRRLLGWGDSGSQPSEEEGSVRKWDQSWDWADSRGLAGQWKVLVLFPLWGDLINGLWAGVTWSDFTFLNITPAVVVKSKLKKTSLVILEVTQSWEKWPELPFGSNAADLG